MLLLEHLSHMFTYGICVKFSENYSLFVKQLTRNCSWSGDIYVWHFNPCYPSCSQKHAFILLEKSATYSNSKPLPTLPDLCVNKINDVNPINIKNIIFRCSLDPFVAFFKISWSVPCKYWPSHKVLIKISFKLI